MIKMDDLPRPKTEDSQQLAAEVALFTMKRIANLFPDLNSEEYVAYTGFALTQIGGHILLKLSEQGVVNISEELMRGFSEDWEN